MDEAGTHLPILCKAFEEGDGPILEMGVGLYSTAVLDMLCKVRQKRTILSIDNDEEWYRFAREKYESDYHKFLYVDDWADAPIDDTFWGLVLIDHRHAHRRHKDIIRLKHKAYYILAHDADPEREQVYGYYRANDHFRYQLLYKECQPNTLVFSNFSPLEELKCPR